MCTDVPHYEMIAGTSGERLLQSPEYVWGYRNNFLIGNSWESRLDFGSGPGDEMTQVVKMPPTSLQE
jgi:hypothetical protein